MDATGLVTSAAGLIAGLGKLPEPEAQPKMIVVSGLPGTGKSYFSRRLAERTGYPIVESDALRKKLFSPPTYSAEESARLFRTIHQLIEELLGRGISVILDATNLTERHRERLYYIAAKHRARLIMVRTHAPPEVVRERLHRRTNERSQEDNSDADWEIYRRMSATVEKIRHHHFVVDTSQDITPALERVVREANR
ncbi:MAG: ATP-binding protein [Dehalococcoidales bacterium]|nr:ATP-binding protein [Dehalococcoidales bacterium]